MGKISEQLAYLKERWSKPCTAKHRGELSPFVLKCSFNYAKSLHSPRILRLPKPLQELWEVVESATLFEDQSYGQWGLKILSPQDSLEETNNFRKERVKEYQEGDMIIGRFIGDSDLLLIRCNERDKDFGTIIIVLPLDTRYDWYKVAPSLDCFFEEYIKTDGDKYWE